MSTFNKELLEYQISEVVREIETIESRIPDDNVLNVYTAYVIKEQVDQAKAQIQELKVNSFKYNHKLKTEDQDKEVDVTPLENLNDVIYSIEIAAKAAVVKDEKGQRMSMSMMPTNPNTRPVSVQLERLSIPTFDGDIGEWNNWYNLFKIAVEENVSISPAQKLLYLRKYLKDEPYAVIVKLEINDVNFKEAIDLLKGRYQSNRRLGSYYLQKLLYYKKDNFNNYLKNHRIAVASLKQLPVEDLEDFILFTLCYNNLDVATQKAFDMNRATSEIPSTEELFDYIQRAAVSETMKTDFTKIEQSKGENQKPMHRNQNKSFTKPFVGFGANDKKYMCNLCSEPHRLFTCDKFKGFTPTERLNLVNKWGVCHNCFGLKHRKEACWSKFSCSTCSKRHHTLLHQENKKNQEDKENPETPKVYCATNENRQVVLGTIKCYVKDRYGKHQIVRCLADNGAQVSLVTRTAAKRLGFEERKETNGIGGISGVKIKTWGNLKTKIYSRVEPKAACEVNLNLIDQICDQLPSRFIPKSATDYFKNLPLADPEFETPASIDILLGCDVYNQILSKQEPVIVSDAQNGLSAIHTIFGYIVSGAVTEKPQENSVFIVQNLDKALEKFWKIEEMNFPKPPNPDDTFCEDLFQRTTHRLPTGKYSVRLPFRPEANPDKLENREQAIANFLNLERKLQQKGLMEEYHAHISEYQDLGHLTLYQGKPAKFIMPQLVVMRENVKTTKMRVVFNASMKVKNHDGPSCTFNDLLLPGPKLQNELPDILLRFRLNQVAVTADVRAMFRMVEVEPEDRIYQHMFYRKNPNEEMQEYEIKVLLFGNKASPYLAQRVVKELVKDEKSDFPEVAELLQENLYVDDFVQSFASVEEAQQRVQEVSELMNRGGFQLRKWASSHPPVLENITTKDMGKIEFKEEEQTLKVLGLLWDPHEDVFTFKAENYPENHVTKRECLSYVAKTFDCMGLVSPVVFWLKSFMQRLWLEKIDWDEHLPDQLKDEWMGFTSKMSEIKHIKIPRCITNKEVHSRKLAGFSDGSEKGYAACMYLVTTYQDGTTSSDLIKSKTKLSPLKTISIPRIELSGFVLLAKLYQNVLNALSKQEFETHLFTDSEIVISWVKKPPHTLQTFVANRVTQILELTGGTQLHHVESKLNPADCASRGTDPSSIKNDTLWWAGPPFLTELESTEWGYKKPKPIPDEELPEIKKIKKQVLAVQKENDLLELVIEKANSWQKLLYTFAYALRFIENTRPKKNQKTIGRLGVDEIQKAEVIVIKLTQEANLKTMERKLRKLSPFVDSKGLLRVGGRVENSELPFAAKHPIILPKYCNVSKIICDHYHRMLLHAGPRTTRAMIQRKYWILSIHTVLRQRIYQCSPCIRWRGATVQPEMGQLPDTRVQVSKPFANTATDFAGPFHTKETTRKRSPIHKTYLCIFICEATKAVHLEAVSDLTTQAFIAALDRFVALRGMPHQIRSDNGRNFLGASRYLKEVGQFLAENDDKIHSCLRARQIVWKLNPAYGSHFGGLFEAGIKQAKSILHRQVGTQILTFEEFSTLVYKVQAILNSRPLVNIPIDPREGTEYLTPGHFLIGDNFMATPEVPVDLDRCLNNRWDRVRQATQRFWKVWTREYLHTNLQKEKWTKGAENLAVGQMVYLKDMQTMPLQWPLGRISNVYPGTDGIVRVAEINSRGKTIRRPVNKLVIMA